MPISIKETLSFGWSTFKARPWFFVAATLLITVGSLLVGAIIGFFTGPEESASGLSQFVNFVLSTIFNVFVGMGSMHLMLKAHDSVSSARLSDLWYPRPFWKYLGAYLIIMVASAILVMVPTIAASALLFGSGTVTSPEGFITAMPLLVLIAIVAALLISPFISFTLPMVVDRNMGPIQAFKENFRIAKSRWFQLVLFFVVIGLVNLLGLIALVVGLLVAVPVTMLAMIHLYRSLMGAAAPAPAPAVEPPPAPAPMA